jgi:hypothetical protein
MDQETSKLNHIIQIMREECNRELVAMKDKLEGFVKEVNSELTQVAVNTKIMTDSISKDIYK